MWANIMAVIGAIKSIASVVSTIKEWVEKYQDKKIDNHYESKQVRRSRLIKQIEMEKDDEKLKELHRKLHNLDSSPN